MSIRERHFGPIAEIDGNGNIGSVNVGALVRRLILFEGCTLVSIRHRELPDLIRIFGVHGVFHLLEEPGFEIIDDILVTSTLNLNSELSMPGFENAGKAINHHIVRSVALVRDLNKYPDEVMSRLEGIDISESQRKKLRAKLLRLSKTYPAEVSQSGIDDFRIIMESNPDLILTALKQVLAEDATVQEVEKLRIEIRRSLRLDGAFEVTTNLSTEFGFDELAAHELVSKTLRGVSSMIQRIRLMQSMDALTGFREDEKRFLESRLSSLVSPLNPEEKEKTFTRVIELGGWPTVDSQSEGLEIDMERLLAIRNHPDCVDLRLWFQEVRAKSDAEIIDQFPSVREKISFLTHGKSGSRLRALVTNLADFAPVPYLGKVVSVADKFLFDKFLQDSNPVCLLSRNYPSIFE